MLTCRVRCFMPVPTATDLMYSSDSPCPCMLIVHVHSTISHNIQFRVITCTNVIYVYMLIPMIIKTVLFYVTKHDTTIMNCICPNNIHCWSSINCGYELYPYFHSYKIQSSFTAPLLLKLIIIVLLVMIHSILLLFIVVNTSHSKFAYLPSCLFPVIYQRSQFTMLCMRTLVLFMFMHQ